MPNSTHKFYVSLLFFLGIIAISYENWISVVFILVLLIPVCFFKEEYRFLTLFFTTFLVSLLVYQMTNRLIDVFEITKDIRVLLNRFLLVIIIFSLYVVLLIYKKPIVIFSNKPNWKQRLNLPLHSIRLPYFLLIGIVISSLAFLPLIARQDFSEIKSLLVFCFLFSIINATLEEVLWRGLMLSSLIELVSVKSAVLITSVGFGLLHLVVGIPFIISLLFSFGGVIYAMVVLQTKSIYPAIILHFVINIGMVFSGLII